MAALACRRDAQGRRRRDYVFLGAALVAILLGVLPSLSKDYLNVDEAFFVAAARKLAFDPVFYRSVDAGTSGPLNIYLLTVPAWFGAPITYVSARLTGAVLMFGFIVSLYICCAGFLGKRAARLAVLPLLGVVVLSTHYDFLHYSSERFPVFLTGLALALLSRQYFGSDRHLTWRMFALGVVTAAMCLSKLQAAPIALTVALAAVLHAWLVGRAGLRGTFWLVLGAAAVPVALGAHFLHHGVFDEFWESYIARSLAYSDRTGSSLAAKMLAASRMFLAQGEFRWSHLGLVLFGLVILLRWQRRGRSVSARSARPGEPIAAGNGRPRPGVFAGASVPLAFVLVLLATSMYAVARPGNPYEHYLLLLLAPWTLCLAVGILWARRTGIRHVSTRLFVLLALALPAILRVAIPELGSYEYYAQFDTRSSPLVELARQYASEGEFLVVWGWRSELYVKTNMLQGTRFGDSILQLEPTRQAAFFRAQYLRDFEAADPPLFLDAVGPGNFTYEDRSRDGHETFPELARIVRARYSLVADVESVRIYVRRDRMRGLAGDAPRPRGPML